jgi:CheY-like chemotaxis protein
MQPVTVAGPMTSPKTSLTYAVATLGFRRSERRALRRVLEISEDGVPTFRAFDAALRRYPHIVMVNSESPAALEKWNHFERSARRKNVSAVFISRTPDAQHERYVLGRPVLPVLMLTLLEHVASEDHGFVRTSSAPRAEARVLAIVDRLPLRIQLKKVLEPTGTRLDFAGTGERVSARIEAHRYGLIFVDSELCGENAYDLCGRIRRHPRYRRTPMVMLSASVESTDRLKAKLAGCDSVLAKPVDDVILRQLTRELLQAQAESSIVGLLEAVPDDAPVSS